MAKDLDQALAEISAIRSQMARTTAFRGYGPATVAATGVGAASAAVLQALWLDDPLHRLSAYLTLWTATAVVSAALVGVEMVARTRREHGDLASEMLWTAIEQFVPAGVTGALLTLMLQAVAPETCWMLPALWQLVVALGVFASCRFLPPAIFWVGAWYLASGLATLVLARGAHALAPAAMGLPFAVGQLATAAVLHRHREASHGE
jgi:hypothetical protein